MANIAWSNTTPGDDMTASSVDDQLRSDWTAIQTGLEEFMYWTDGSAASAGEWKLSTAKVRSQTTEHTIPQGLGPQGALGAVVHFGPTTGVNVGGENYGVWHIGSSQTMLVGHAQVAEHVTEPSNAPYTARWVMAEGKIPLTVDRAGTLSIATKVDYGVTYNGIPNVIASIEVGRLGMWQQEDPIFGIDDITQSGFSSKMSLINPFGTSVSTWSVCWSSLGTVNW